MRSTSKPHIPKPKVPATPSVTPKPYSHSGARTREAELRLRNDRQAREKAGGGLDERRRLSEIEMASKRAHEKTRAGCDDKGERCEPPVGQPGARKERPMYSISEPPAPK